LFLLFGHGHFGMTGGPTGAKLVTQLMQGHAPFIDPQPMQPVVFEPRADASRLAGVVRLRSIQTALDCVEHIVGQTAAVA